jgi:hypothetical protein
LPHEGSRVAVAPGRAVASHPAANPAEPGQGEGRRAGLPAEVPAPSSWLCVGGGLRDDPPPEPERRRGPEAARAAAVAMGHQQRAEGRRTAGRVQPSGSRGLAGTPPGSGSAARSPSHRSRPSTSGPAHGRAKERAAQRAGRSGRSSTARRVRRTPSAHRLRRCRQPPAQPAWAAEAPWQSGRQRGAGVRQQVLPRRAGQRPGCRHGEPKRARGANRRQRRGAGRRRGWERGDQRGDRDQGDS